MANNETKLLWGREVEIVKWGLSEEQVTDFVSDLIKQRDNLLSKQQHLSSLHMLAEKTVTEANSLAEQIKQEAHSEAERILAESEEKARNSIDSAQSQADRTVAEANDLAEQAVSEANELAENTVSEANELAEKTLSEANELAEQKILEARDLAEQTKQEAESQATRVLEEAEEKARNTIDEAQTQADKTVAETNELVAQIKQEAQSQAERVLEEAEEKVQEIINEAQSQAEKTVAEADELAEKKVVEANELSEQTKQVARDRSDRILEDAEEKAQEIVAEAQSQAEAITHEKTTRLLEQAEHEATTIIETAKKQVLTEIEDFRDRFHSRLQNLITEIGTVKEVMEQAGIQQIEEDESEFLPYYAPISEASDNGNGTSYEAEDDFESDLASLMADYSKTIEEDAIVDSDDEITTLAPVQDEVPVFKGEIEIAMAPPVNMAQLIRFRRNLQQVAHLKIVRTTGSWKEGSVTTAIIEKELPLINLLGEMPEVEKAELWTNGENNNGEYPSEGNRLVVTLKDESELSDKVLEEWL